MPTQPIQTLPSKAFVLILITLAIAIFALAIDAQQLHRGVSVKMAVTTSAPSLPDADNDDAWIVTITENGDLYFGADPITPEGLSQTMKARPRIRGQELYVKADARASFTSVRRVLGIAREDRFGKVFLLTSQQGETKPGTPVVPKGLPVWISSEPNALPVVVHVGAGQGSPMLKVNDEQIPLKALQNRLDQLLDDQNDRVVMIQTGQVPFADVAHVVDVCNMSSARCVVSMPEL